VKDVGLLSRCGPGDDILLSHPFSSIECMFVAINGYSVQPQHGSGFPSRARLSVHLPQCLAHSFPRPTTSRRP
jgi:hypothetical protein